MDIDTLANFISSCGKTDFEIACRIVLQDILNLNIVNVDGSRDGGTDYSSFNNVGGRTKTAYQITTQKTDIKNKAYKDAKKCIEKIHAERYYFLCTYNLDEIKCRSLESTISDELGIASSVYSPKIIAGMMVNHHKVGFFLDRIGYDDLRKFDNTRVDYREMALHAYSFLSQDTKNLKSQIYDDAILLVLAENKDGLKKGDIVQKVINLLCLPPTKEDMLLNRINTLKSKAKIANHTTEDDTLVATSEVISDISERKIIYEKELSSLASAQIDIFNDYGVEWTLADSQQASVWLAATYMQEQLKALESANAAISDGFLKINKNGIINLKKFLKERKEIKEDIIDEIIDKLLKNAATHPVMIKITSASVYLALEGGNPIMACRALGVNSWHEEKMIIEPTLGIPYLCSLLYKGRVNRYFDYAIQSVNRAHNLGIELYIPYYYIKECAGHLHMARKFDGLDLNPDEMQYSCNAFVSNYYALKKQKIAVPDKFIDYLATFSPAIRTEINYKDWIRAIMTNLQSFFTRNGIIFQEVPNYSSDDLKREQNEYNYYLKENGIDKSDNLMQNDSISLHFTNERSDKNGEHWMVLTYDRTLINVANNLNSSTWVNTPFTFMELTEMSKDLSEKEFSSLVHSMATFRPETLSISARVLDRIILYASDKMQDWQFKQLTEQFKNDIIKSISIDDTNFLGEVDKRTNEFLLKHGIDVGNEKSDVDLITEQMC